MEKIGKAYSVLEGHIVMAGGGMNFCGLSDFVTRTFFPDMSSVILDQRIKEYKEESHYHNAFADSNDILFEHCFH